MSFIEARGLRFSYETEDEGKKEVLHGIDLDIEEGEFVALLGHNGCGKSTMAKLFNGMLLPTEGRLLVDGIDTLDESRALDVRRRVGLVLQNPDNQLVAGVVEEDVAFGPENLGVPPGEIRKRVDEALKAVDMYHYRGHAPHKLSGGQKQRVAIAGVIAMETRCIVLDEPTAMLDPRGRTEVMDTIKKLNREKGITIVLITHYMDEAVQAGRVVVMDNGSILMDGAPREVFSNVERLKRHALDVPQATELCYRLRSAGVDLGGSPLSVEECVELFRQKLKAMEIIPAGLDSPELLELFSEHDGYMMEFLGEHRKYYTPYSPAERIGRAWIVYVDGEPAGCAAYREQAEGVGELKRVFIRPGYRGRGISKALVSTVEDYARGRQDHILALDTNSALEPAVMLYRHMGYRVVFQEGKYIKMEKELRLDDQSSP